MAYFVRITNVGAVEPDGNVEVDFAIDDEGVEVLGSLHTRCAPGDVKARVQELAVPLRDALRQRSNIIVGERFRIPN